jgi:hypothetical protein
MKEIIRHLELMGMLPHSFDRLSLKRRTDAPILYHSKYLDAPQIIEVYKEGKYETITFNVEDNDQTIFESLLTEIKVGDKNKTELYISGVRYNHNDDYTILDNGTLVWLDNFKLVEGQRCVFVCR